jgi:hypothetical protein
LRNREKKEYQDISSNRNLPFHSQGSLIINNLAKSQIYGRVDLSTKSVDNFVLKIGYILKYKAFRE